ncbi:MAG: Gfo/Idh/MocA family oxidoreductase [Planctomycetota bacterium]|nr:Gfo/Idh/MocA family oxidoreductase [Planctomycetota bacterium]MDP7253467.1 Gfo/Idh/MocA family oxidoreductase [Planctomycetota bacterium]
MNHPLRLAFMGFRHAHIYDVYRKATEHPGIEIVAACEEDGETREGIISSGSADITHETFRAMLDVDCDAVAVGDYYGKRGSILIESMKRGKHVIGDKPLCTGLDELDQIEKLSKEKNLSVGCQLDMRCSGNFLKLRELILNGDIGEVHAISFNGQHPLNYGSRPNWYFEEGKHCGTINDIAIHAVDFLPWATGMKITSINAARNWNASLPEVPFFLDSAQMMLTMENGCGVLGDVSYLTPTAAGYSLPQYWRVNVWGQKGMLETSATEDGVLMYSSDVKDVQRMESSEPMNGAYLDAFVNEINGERDVFLSTDEVLMASRTALMVQRAADEGMTNVVVS